MTCWLWVVSTAFAFVAALAALYAALMKRPHP